MENPERAGFQIVYLFLREKKKKRLEKKLEICYNTAIKLFHKGRENEKAKKFIFYMDGVLRLFDGCCFVDGVRRGYA